jgi:hypothetical protein
LETKPIPSQYAPSIEYCQVPLPVVAVTAIPLAAPTSASAQPLEVKIELTDSAEDGASSLVPDSVTVLLAVIVGA